MTTMGFDRGPSTKVNGSMTDNMDTVGKFCQKRNEKKK